MLNPKEDSISFLAGGEKSGVFTWDQVLGNTALNLLLLTLGVLPMPHWMQPVVAGAAGLAMGSSRTPRDVMLKDAIPPGQMGKVFGFVSAGLPLGGAITPVPVGMLIDYGLAALVLPLAALLLLGSLLCMGRASSAARSARPFAVPAE